MGNVPSVLYGLSNSPSMKKREQKPEEDLQCFTFFQEEI